MPLGSLTHSKPGNQNNPKILWAADAITHGDDRSYFKKSSQIAGGFSAQIYGSDSMGKTKNINIKQARIKWWRNLSDSQKDKQIKIWQEQKAERRKIVPVKFRGNKNKYPWYDTGINANNRKQWLNVILSKNPWLNNLYE